GGELMGAAVYTSLRVGRSAGRLVGGLLERLDRAAGLATALQQDLDLLLRGLERALAVARERDAALEDLQRLIEGQIAALQTLHQALELRQRLFEVGDFAVARHVGIIPGRLGGR